MNQQRIEDSARDGSIKVRYSWLMQVLLVLDQFGNVLAGGNSDITISGRAGYHVHVPEGEGGAFWKKMEGIINYTFYPLDGPHHCLMAYCSDKDEHYRGSKLIFKIILVILIVLFCLLLFIPIRLIALFKFARTRYVLPTGEEIPYEDLNMTISKLAKMKDPCQILEAFAKKSNH
jgi:hypothetical protein